MPPAMTDQDENHLDTRSQPPLVNPIHPPVLEASQKPNISLTGEQSCTSAVGKHDATRPRARALFADRTIQKHAENSGTCMPDRSLTACTPDRSLTLKKHHGNRNTVYATPLRPRKGIGRQTNADAEASTISQRVEIGTPACPNSLRSEPEAPAWCTLPTSKGNHIVDNSCSGSGLRIQHSAQHSEVLICEQFQLEQDKNFWMDHNVQVLIRVRPLNNAEIAAHGMSRCLRQESAHALTWTGQPETQFTFDHVADESVTQENLFQVAGLPMVDNCISGYNSCIFAYGQTGSGKTYTMLGDIEDGEHGPNPERGMIPRIFEYLFSKIEMEEIMHQQEDLKFTCKCSFLEIYNEQITDLLEPSSTNLQIHEDPKRGLYVENLQEIDVRSVTDLMELLLQGAANRRVAQTRMNQESSRSHCVFTCRIESQWVSDSVTNYRFGRLNLVDLAGSERQKASGAEGERLREAANINKSLSTLGMVIMILVDVAHGKQRHVPYRDSKLTYLLQESLGGNSKTAIIATISPSLGCSSETLSTLKFAQRAKFIQNNAIINKDASGDIMTLRTQVQDLKEELEKLRKQTEMSKTSPSVIRNITLNKIFEKMSTSSNNIQVCHTISTADNDFANEMMEAILRGCLRREKLAVQEKDQLTEEKQHLDSLVQELEREIDYLRSMLQLKEEKVERLECVADTILSTEDYYQQENKALQQELQLLQKRINHNPELVRFALENKRLIEQVRRYESFHGGERELLIAEVASLREQILDLLEKNTEQQRPEDQLGGKQVAAHIEEGVAQFDEPAYDEKVLQTGCDVPIHNSELESSQKGLMIFLQEGNEALDEALSEMKGMPANSFRETDTHTHLNLCTEDVNVHSSDAFYHVLQQAYDMAKDVESHVRILYETVILENKRKRNIEVDGILPASQDKRMKTMQQEEVSGFNEQSELLKVSHEWRTKRKMKDCQSRSAYIEQGTQEFCNQLISDMMERKCASFPNQYYELSEQRYCDTFAKDATDASVAGLKNDSIIKQLEIKLTEANLRLQDYEYKFAALHETIENLRCREEKWRQEKRNLQLQVERLHSITAGNEKEIIALQNEEATLRAIVKKMDEEEGRLSEELGSIKYHLSCFEHSRLMGEEHMDIQSTQGNNEQVEDSRLVAEEHTDKQSTQDDNGWAETFSSIKKEVKKALASLHETEVDRGFIKSLQLEQKDAQLIAQKQKHLEKIASKLTSMVILLEDRLQEAEAAWKQEKSEIMTDLNETKLNAAEKIGEASEALRRFNEGQQIMKEAEFMVSALTSANEKAKLEKLSLISQWQTEREVLVSKIEELRRVIAQQDEKMHTNTTEIQEMLQEIEQLMELSQEEIGTFIQNVESTLNSCCLELQQMHVVKRKVESLFQLQDEFRSASADQFKTGTLTECSIVEPKVLPYASRLINERGSQAQIGVRSVSLPLGSLNETVEEQSAPQGMMEGLGAVDNHVNVGRFSALLAVRAPKQASMNSGQEDYSNKQKVGDFCVEPGKLSEEKELDSPALLIQLQEPTSGVHEMESALACKTDANVTCTLQASQKPAVDIHLQLQNYEKATSNLLEKLDCIVARISEMPGAGEAWICFLNNFELALSKLEVDASACISCSDLMWERFTKTLAEKKVLEQELERKQEVLEGSFFDLSLLQEKTAESNDMKDQIEKALLIIRSLQEELETRSEQLKSMEGKNIYLETEMERSTQNLHSLEMSLSEVQRYTLSIERENTELRKVLDDTIRRVSFLEDKLQDRRHTIEELEIQLFEMNSLVEQKMIQALESINQELSSAICEKNQLECKLFALNEELVSSNLSIDEHRREANDVKKLLDISNRRAQEKEDEVKLLKLSVEELETTVNVLQSQMESLQREVDVQQLIKEDLEMELQILRHEMYGLQTSKPAEQPRNTRSIDTKQQLFEAQTEVSKLKQQIEQKEGQIRNLKLQLEELIAAAEKQAAGYQDKLLSLEAMTVEQQNKERDGRHLSLTPKRGGDKIGKCPTSPFKCMTSGLVRQISYEMDEELYSSKKRIDDLESLAASRQKEIFRLSKKLGEAEAMTYAVIRDLLGLKSDISSHATLWLDYKELQKIADAATHQTKVALLKEEELEVLRVQYKDERESWLADASRRQAEVVAARVAMEKFRQKDFILKAENKRLKVDLSRQKKRLLQLQEKLKMSLGLGESEYHLQPQTRHLQAKDEDLQVELSHTETLLNHVNNALSQHQMKKARRRRAAERLEAHG